MSYEMVIDFWFNEIDSSKWWLKDVSFDEAIRNRFLTLHQQAIKAELAHWRSSAQGRLAEIIILDQFSRNMYRYSPQAFSNDAMALVLSQEAISLGLDKQLNEAQRSFLYMPFMHSESRIIHQHAVELYKASGNETSYNFEIKHKEIIDRFGRYPHRNIILNRKSTSEELAFLNEPNSSF
ncbi:DUF924 family protein [Colwelliaceae bacterium MEBiC 14330]